ncbi:MAG: hypothetical protein VB099_11140 [Candidatus Limiplasma sp.]|nr:hypothetical protein [Candidatus Limiplasma sp.]
MESKRALLSQETFCCALRMIGEQEAINEEVTKALRKVSVGCFTFGCDNKWLEALLMVLKEAIHDQYDYIEWWLYDAAKEYKVWSSDEGGKEWYLKEPEALYDFIVSECQD